MKIAVIHEWLNDWAGSEQVLAAILEVLPGADLYAVVDFLAPADRLRLAGRAVRTSFIQRLPWARRRLELYLPLMPLAVEQFDLAGYDLVVSNSHAVAKGVLTGPDQVHLSYVHSPMRYAWDLQPQYLAHGGLGRGVRGAAARLALHYLRLWDVRTAHGVDRMACNSEFIARRIRKCYGRDARVIHPPVAVGTLPFRADKEDFYLAAGRLHAYKRVDLIIEAFRRLPERSLIVIGGGPEFERLRRGAPPNVTCLGQVPDAVLHDHLARARALVFAAVEDFGIVPVEAQACGTPVIALGRGGAVETVRDLAVPRPTGVLFAAQTAEAIVAAVHRFEAAAIDPADCRDNAARFGALRFAREFRAWVDESLAQPWSATSM